VLKLRFASGGYDRMEAILRGVIAADGIELDFNEINEPRRIFDGMLGEDAFDVSELSSSEYITRRARADFPDDFPFVAIPVFPSRAFRHGFIFINKRSGIETPQGSRRQVDRRPATFADGGGVDPRPYAA